MKPTNRRSFIKNSFIVLGGASIASSKVNFRKTTLDKSAVITRTLGKTGLELPIISLGTGDIKNPELVEAALKKGIKLLATSQYYGNGNNETMLGEVLKKQKRNAYYIASSAMPEGFDHKSGTFTGKTNGNAFIENINQSLKRLNIEYLDIVFMPFMATRESVFNDDYLKAMEQLKKEGKARFIGIATHKFEHEAIRAAVDVKIYDLVMTQYNFRKSTLSDINESIDYATDAGLGIIAMKTMAGAYWDKERTRPINTKAALKWVLQNKNIHTTVPGITNYNQLDDDWSIMEDIALTEQEKSDLISVQAVINNVYCEQCNYCVGQCIQNMDIPTYMRSFMYAYGYQNISQAKKTLALTTESKCYLCQNCVITCKSGFDIKSKITDIERLRNIPFEFIS